MLITKSYIVFLCSYKSVARNLYNFRLLGELYLVMGDVKREFFRELEGQMIGLCGTRFLHFAMLRIAPVEMTGYMIATA